MRKFKSVLATVLAVLILALSVPLAIAGPVAFGAYAVVLTGVVLYAVTYRGLQVAPGLQANTITNLLPLLYSALDIVSRELVGFIPAVARDSNAEQAALNQVVNIYVTPAATATDITPGVTAPNDGDNVIGNQTMTINKSKYVPIRWNGEEMKQVTSSGQMQNVVRDQFTQAMRTLCNLVEVDIGVAAYQGAARSTGSAGNAPFATASDLSDAAAVMRILDDDGAPLTGRQLVLGTAAMQNIRGKQSVLFKVNEAGTDDLLRQGILGRLEGMDVRTSAGIQTPTKGTGAAYTSTAAGFAIGTTSIPLITGTGTILAGDTVTFAGDTNKYVVAVGGGIAAPGTIVINKPGLMQALPASAQALTIGSTAAQNIMFYRGAIQLATRVPAMPEGGDMADDITTITDPISGLAFQVALYRQYRQIRWEFGLAWGVKAVKTEHISVLLG